MTQPQSRYKLWHNKSLQATQSSCNSRVVDYKAEKIVNMSKLFFGLLAFIISGSALGHGMSEADKAKAMEASNLDFIQLGASHMITGYDHLLFLFGVIFFLTKFNAIVKFVTAFTIGHSITLLFATLYHIQANYYLIDAVIALTVIYKGFDNLDGFRKYLNVNSPNLLLMVFVFGLIHGFGLSTRLQMLPLPEEGLVLKILSFNLGVELGQIAALTIMLLLLSGWRKSESFRNFNNATNASLIGVGALLFLMQLHGYSHSSHPDEYPLNKDEQPHIHEAMKALDQAMQQKAPQPEPLPHVEQEMEVITQPAHKPAKKEPTLHTHGDGKHHHH